MKPLSGVRIAVTRAAAQSSELAEPLEQAGAIVFRCPLIRVEPFPIDEHARRVLATLHDFTWVVFTSANGVEQLMRVLAEAKVDPGVLRHAKIACVGPATAAAIAALGLRPAAVPARFVGDAVTRAMLESGPVRGQKVLIARAAGGGQALPSDLRENGADVVDWELYRSVIDSEGAARLKQLMANREIDVLTFTSGSAVDYFVRTVDPKIESVVAVIGPSTADAARARGLPVDIEADPHTIPGLVHAILNYYAARRGTLEV